MFVIVASCYWLLLNIICYTYIHILIKKTFSKSCVKKHVFTKNCCHKNKCAQSCYKLKMF